MEEQNNLVVNLELTVQEINQVLAGLETFTKPLMAKIVTQANTQINKQPVQE